MDVAFKIIVDPSTRKIALTSFVIDVPNNQEIRSSRIVTDSTHKMFFSCGQKQLVQYKSGSVLKDILETVQTSYTPYEFTKVVKTSPVLVQDKILCVINARKLKFWQVGDEKLAKEAPLDATGLLPLDQMLLAYVKDNIHILMPESVVKQISSILTFEVKQTALPLEKPESPPSQPPAPAIPPTQTTRSARKTVGPVDLPGERTIPSQPPQPPQSIAPVARLHLTNVSTINFDTKRILKSLYSNTASYIINITEGHTLQLAHYFEKNATNAVIGDKEHCDPSPVTLTFDDFPQVRYIYRHLLTL
jgi:hypothetical protein